MALSASFDSRMRKVRMADRSATDGEHIDLAPPCAHDQPLPPVLIFLGVKDHELQPKPRPEDWRADFKQVRISLKDHSQMIRAV